LIEEKNRTSIAQLIFSFCKVFSSGVKTFSFSQNQNPEPVQSTNQDIRLGLKSILSLANQPHLSLKAGSIKVAWLKIFSSSVLITAGFRRAMFTFN